MACPAREPQGYSKDPGHCITHTALLDHGSLGHTEAQRCVADDESQASRSRSGDLDHLGFHAEPQRGGLSLGGGIGHPETFGPEWGTCQ